MLKGSKMDVWCTTRTRGGLRKAPTSAKQSALVDHLFLFYFKLILAIFDLSEAKSRIYGGLLIRYVRVGYDVFIYRKGRIMNGS